jgi:hypothetical protein
MTKTTTRPRTTTTRPRTDYSSQDMSFAVRLANQGRGVAQIERALSKIPKSGRPPISVKYVRLVNEKGLDTANAYARLTAEKAVTWVKENPRVSDRASGLVRLGELQALADGLPWALYGGVRARRLLEGAYVTAERLDSLRFGLALRQWSEQTGVEFDAVRKGRKMLTDLGWLQRNPRDRNGRTSRFLLSRPRHIQPLPATFTSHGMRCECGDSGDAKCWLPHDAFRPRALSDAGWYALASMSVEGVTLRELELQTGIVGDELVGLVVSMDRFGVVEFDGSVVRRGPDLVAGLDAIAAHHGTEGMLAAERAQYDEERQAFRARGTEA